MDADEGRVHRLDQLPPAGELAQLLLLRRRPGRKVHGGLADEHEHRGAERGGRQEKRPPADAHLEVGQVEDEAVGPEGRPQGEVHQPVDLRHDLAAGDRPAVGSTLEGEDHLFHTSARLSDGDDGGGDLERRARRFHGSLDLEPRFLPRPSLPDVVPFLGALLFVLRAPGPEPGRLVVGLPGRIEPVEESGRIGLGRGQRRDGPGRRREQARQQHCGEPIPRRRGGRRGDDHLDTPKGPQVDHTAGRTPSRRSARSWL